jgi:hypothetical protein
MVYIKSRNKGSKEFPAHLLVRSSLSVKSVLDLFDRAFANHENLMKNAAELIEASSLSKITRARWQYEQATKEYLFFDIDSTEMEELWDWILPYLWYYSDCIERGIKFYFSPDHALGFIKFYNVCKNDIISAKQLKTAIARSVVKSACDLSKLSGLHEVSDYDYEYLYEKSLIGTKGYRIERCNDLESMLTEYGFEVYHGRIRNDNDMSSVMLSIRSGCRNQSIELAVTDNKVCFYNIQNTTSDVRALVMGHFGDAFSKIYN